MKKLSNIFLVVTLTLISWVPKEDIEAAKYRNYIIALKNESTSNFFVVVKIKDMKSGVIKEICTKGNFLKGALHKELSMGYNARQEQKIMKYAIGNKSMYFEFAKKEALNNVSFYDYDATGRVLMSRKYDMDSIKAVINKGGDFSLNTSDEQAEWIAHELFNIGVLTKDGGCFRSGLHSVREL